MVASFDGDPSDWVEDNSGGGFEQWWHVDSTETVMIQQHHFDYSVWPGSNQAICDTYMESRLRGVVPPSRGNVLSFNVKHNSRGCTLSSHSTILEGGEYKPALVTLDLLKCETQPFYIQTVYIDYSIETQRDNPENLWSCP